MVVQHPEFDITPEKEASKLSFFKRQFGSGAKALTRRDVDLSGKTAIITGANGDLGLNCAKQLLDLGIAKIILTARDVAKGQKAADSLKPLGKGVTVEVWKLDYGSYDSITSFAERVGQLSPRVDIALLNAGVNRASFVVNASTGHEEHIQTNYLSTVLLLLLLLDIFKKDHRASPGRLTVTSSDTAAWAVFPEKSKTPILPAFDVSSPKFDFNERYATSKLLGQLFITELAKRVPASVATVNCANPGLCYSGLQREFGGAVNAVVRVVGRNPTLGAWSLTHAAAYVDATSHGQYVEDGKLRPMAPLIYSKEGEQVAEKLWNETLDELAFAGVKDIVSGF